MYAFFVLSGLGLSALIARALPSPSSVAPADRVWLRAAALTGAVLGAYGFEAPADLFGWAYRPEGAPEVGLLGGRTVLGGILGGWGAVELCKAWRGVRGSTGDLFALPLAVALAVGRLGCVTEGCCPGVPVERGSVWALVDGVLHRTPERFPATLLEAYFHVAAAVVLWATRARAWPEGVRFAGYVGAYAVARFALEFARENPRLVLGLSWYQGLSGLLFAAALVRGASAWRPGWAQPATMAKQVPNASAQPATNMTTARPK